MEPNTALEKFVSKLWGCVCQAVNIRPSVLPETSYLLFLSNDYSKLPPTIRELRCEILISSHSISAIFF